jgi:hypothetical protein
MPEGLRYLARPAIDRPQCVQDPGWREAAAPAAFSRGEAHASLTVHNAGTQSTHRRFKDTPGTSLPPARSITGDLPSSPEIARAVRPPRTAHFLRNPNSAMASPAKPSLELLSWRPPRAYWKGYLKLSLVICPIALYPASSQAEKTHSGNRAAALRLSASSKKTSKPQSRKRAARKRKSKRAA